MPLARGVLTVVKCQGGTNRDYQLPMQRELAGKLPLWTLRENDALRRKARTRPECQAWLLL